MIISYYEKINGLNKNMDLKDIFPLFNDKNIENITNNVRKYDKKTQKELYRAEQANLPVIVPGAIFNTNSFHSIENISERTNLLLLDYDDFEDDVENIFNTLIEKFPYVHMIYRSSGGKGLKVLIKVYLDSILNVAADMTDDEINNEYNNAHKLYYDYIGEQLYSIINILPDDKAKDITRCTFISYDPKFYYNRNSIQFKITKSEADNYYKKKLKAIKKDKNKTISAGTTQEVLFLNEVINFIVDKQIDITSDYNNWIYLAYLCKKIYNSDIAKKQFHMLSQFNPQYKMEETTKKFENILKIDKDKPTSFSYLDKILKDAGITFIPKTSKNLFNEKLQVTEIQRIMDYENWEIKYCKIKKLNLVKIPNLNNPHYPDDIIPLELSGRKGYPVIWKYFKDNYNMNIQFNDIDKNIYSYKSTEFNFLEDKLKLIKTDDSSEYDRFFTLIDSPMPIQSGMTRWFMGCFQNWLLDYGRKFDECLIFVDDKGGIGKTDLIENYLFKIFKYYSLRYVTSNTNFNVANKDAFMDDSQNLVSYKPEISGNILKNSELVKDYISRRQTNLRVPYGRNNEEFTNYCSYIGDTNEEQFLSAEQNRRRFIIIKITGLHFENANMDWEKFWGYLYYLWADKGITYKDYTSINNEEYIELNTNLSILEEILTKNDKNLISAEKIISIVKNNISSFNCSKNEVCKFLKLKGFEIKSVWDQKNKKTIKGWNVQINLNNLEIPVNIPLFD